MMDICWGHKPGWGLPFCDWPARAILYGSHTRGIEVTKAGCPRRALHHLLWVTPRPVFFLSLPPVFSGFAHSSAANSQFSLREWRSWEDLPLGIMTNLPIPKLTELGSDHLSLSWLNFCAEKINPKNCMSVLLGNLFPLCVLPISGFLAIFAWRFLANPINSLQKIKSTQKRVAGHCFIVGHAQNCSNKNPLYLNSIESLLGHNPTPSWLENSVIVGEQQSSFGSCW